MPLVTDDEDYPQEESQEQPEPIEQFAQKTVETGVSFKKMMMGFGGWLARRKLPDEAKQQLRRLGEEVWFSKEDLQKRRREMEQGKEKKKWTGTPFRSFGPKKGKKGKL
jgi:hypothetical protein